MVPRFVSLIEREAIGPNDRDVVSNEAGEWGLTTVPSESEHWGFIQDVLIQVKIYSTKSTAMVKYPVMRSYLKE